MGVARGVDDLAGRVDAVVVAVAVGDPADRSAAGLGRERAFEVAGCRVREHPTGSVDTCLVDRESEDAGLARIARAQRSAVLHGVRRGPPGVDSARRRVEGDEAALDGVVDQVEASSGDHALTARLHHQRVDLLVGGRRPVAQRTVGGREGGEVLARDRVRLREVSRDIDRVGAHRDAVHACTADGRGEAGDQLPGLRVERGEVVAGGAVDLSERAADVDARTVRRRRDRFDHTVDGRGEALELTGGDVICQYIVTRRETRPRGSERSPSIRETPRGVDDVSDGGLSPHVSRIDLHRRQRVGCDHIGRALEQRGLGRGHGCGRAERNGDDGGRGERETDRETEGRAQTGTGGSPANAHQEIFPVKIATGSPAA
ncbi:hypothetical protein SRABI44_02625 [Microbacterium foliorum]|nr:hypothetical protein SRABI44_02625 [Microbacterium foliorum]CAH0245429.1 hypothetical protein SRABI03_03079 [Microbacterium foliorum]